MPTSYSFITFGDLRRMRDEPAKSQIRKHAMKDIGVSRRRPRPWTVEFAVRSSDTDASCSDCPSATVQKLPLADTAGNARPVGLEDCFVRGEAPFMKYSRFGGLIAPVVSAGSDPFGSASVGISGTTEVLLQYFVYYSSAFPNNFTFSPCISHTVAAAIHDELLMNCVLSAAASRLHYLQGISRPEFRRQEAVATQQGLRLLKSAVPTTCTRSISQVQRLITCVLYLSAGAYYRHDTAAARIHLNAAVTIAQSAGGITQLKDEQTIVRLVSIDDLLSCAELGPCSVDDSYDPGPSVREDQDDLSESYPNQSIFSAFESIDDRVLPSELRDAIPQIIACRGVKCGIAGSDRMTNLLGLKMRHWATLRMLAIRNRLLAFVPSDDRASAMRLTLIMWTLLPPCDPRQARLSQKVAVRLVDLLVDIPDHAWMESEGVRFACLKMGYFCAEERSEAHTWFAEEVRRVIREKHMLLGLKLGDGLRESLIAFQKQIYFDEPGIRKRTEALADYVRYWDCFAIT